MALTPDDIERASMALRLRIKDAVQATPVDVPALLEATSGLKALAEIRAMIDAEEPLPDDLPPNEF